MSGTWVAMANPAPFGVSTMLLLTDGTVMCQQFGQRYWWRLKPSPWGDYASGTWTPLAAMDNDPMYYASAVLADGRVLVAGGELDNFVEDVDLLKAQVYDPVIDGWSDLPTPDGWTNIGDAPGCMLEDGRFLLGEVARAVPGQVANATALFDPKTNTWLAAGVGRKPVGSGGVPSPGTPPKDDTSSEETWTLLPDGSVLTVECTNHPKAEKYLPGPDVWVSAGSTALAGVDLVDAGSIEIGPAILMYDGRVFCVGASGHTALYTLQAVPTDPGAWTRGPDLPTDARVQLMQAKDAPACLMPNGRVLFCAGPSAQSADDYPGPTQFFEFDGAVIQAVANPPNGDSAPYTGRMLLLPTGDVLYSNGTQQLCIYVTDKSSVLAPAPSSISLAGPVRAGQTFTINGAGLNGASQAVSYGDDASMATNYPLVRVVYPGALTDPNDSSRRIDRVCYWRTFNHSTTGVRKDAAASTTCLVPLSAPRGSAQLFVVANGMASAAQAITVQ